MNVTDIKTAREALDNMDDYARMNTGVDAIGPRKVLEDFIAAVERAVSPAESVQSIDTLEFRELLKKYHRSTTWETKLIAHIDTHIAKAREEGRQAGLKHAIQTIKNSNDTAQDALRQRDEQRQRAEAAEKKVDEMRARLDAALSGKLAQAAWQAPDLSELTRCRIDGDETGADIFADRDGEYVLVPYDSMQSLLALLLQGLGEKARTLSKAEIDDIVYKCRQSGNDTTYDIVAAAIAASFAQPSDNLQQASTAQVEPDKEGIKPDPDHLAALALSGALPDAQAEQVLRDAGVIKEAASATDDGSRDADA